MANFIRSTVLLPGALGLLVLLQHHVVVLIGVANVLYADRRHSLPGKTIQFKLYFIRKFISDSFTVNLNFKLYCTHCVYWPTQLSWMHFTAVFRSFCLIHLNSLVFCNWTKVLWKTGENWRLILIFSWFLVFYINLVLTW